MDSLEDFEKSLATEKAERERAAQEKAERKERKERKHKHQHRRDKSSERDRNRDRDRDRDRDKDRSAAEDGGQSRHSVHHRHRKHRDEEPDEDGHRHKRSRHERDEESSSNHRHRHHGHEHQPRNRGNREDRGEKFVKQSDPKEDLPLPDEEKTPAEEARPAKPLVRESWMTAPSALDVDYIHRGAGQKSPPPVAKEPQRVLHKNELNTRLGNMDDAGPAEEPEDAASGEADYKFGDEGSQWRMTKLSGVYNVAEETGRPVDEVALERFGSLQDFDAAREEKIEMDRRKVYGKGYVGKEKPTGELYRERQSEMKSQRQEGREDDRQDDELPEQGVVVEESVRSGARVDQSTLNQLRAQLMRAKMRKAPDVGKLEAEYNAALASFESGAASTNAVVLDASHSRMLAGSRGEVKAVENKRGRERGLVEENNDMSIEDMVREERRTKGQAGGEGMRLAERIAKDAKFDDDINYLDENAEKLAKRVHQNETNLKNVAVSEYKKLNRILDTCPLCHHEDREPPKDLPIAPIVSLATRVFLTLPTEPELTGAEGGAIIVPISHRTNLLECDDDEWEEMRNFMKSLTRLYHDQGREVIFYENAAAPQRRLHAALVAVPIPYSLGDTAPAFFREAILSTDEEWSQHKKIIDTAKQAREGLGKLAFRRTIAKEMPYFHVWFSLDGGLGHIVEDSERWPRGDLFAREIIGGMLDCEPDVIKRQGRWSRSDPRLEGFKKWWRKFDWTRILTEGQ